MEQKERFNYTLKSVTPSKKGEKPTRSDIFCVDQDLSEGDNIEGFSPSGDAALMAEGLPEISSASSARGSHN